MIRTSPHNLTAQCDRTDFVRLYPKKGVVRNHVARNDDRCVLERKEWKIIVRAHHRRVLSATLLIRTLLPPVRHGALHLMLRLERNRFWKNRVSASGLRLELFLDSVRVMHTGRDIAR